MSLRNLLTTGVGIMYPVLSAEVRPWNATPTTLPFWRTGPPEFPGLIAASIWITRCWSALVCAYGLKSILDTTPRVTEMRSPPTGYPMTRTWDSS